MGYTLNKQSTNGGHGQVTGNPQMVFLGQPQRPAAIDLRAENDSGMSDHDNVTSNAVLVFDVPATPSFRVYRDGIRISGLFEIGMAYTTAPHADGVYRYAITCVDAAGNESPLSDALVVTINTAKPAIGDVDGDGNVNGQDIYPFLIALKDREQCATQFPRAAASLPADTNSDTLINGQDIYGFLQALKGIAAQVNAQESLCVQVPADSPAIAADVNSLGTDGSIGEAEAYISDTSFCANDDRVRCYPGVQSSDLRLLAAAPLSISNRYREEHRPVIDDVLEEVIVFINAGAAAKEA